MMHTATYSPEDNKIRLYVGRVPRDEYERLRAAGYVSTPKQDCDFVATWTPEREDIAREYLEDDEDIGDEDYSPEERAADRAERFGEYRDKRAGEAGASADAFDAGPSAFGHQDRARAERQAVRHDRKRVYAVSQWSKAEYWQRRTEGVINHALYKSSAHVRRGRILTLEAEQRKHEADRTARRERYMTWQAIATMPGAEELIPLDENGHADLSKANEAGRKAYTIANYGHSWWRAFHPTSEEANEESRRIHKGWGAGFSAYEFLTDTAYVGKPFERLTPKQVAELYLSKNTHPDTPGTYSARWSAHYELRLTYEKSMLANEGGMAGDAEMEVGGWIGRHQIHKINKSAASGRVVSVTVKVPGDKWGRTTEGHHMAVLNIERMGTDAYRAPTDEEREAFKAAKKAAKAPPVSTINPTDLDAERFQAWLNDQAAGSAREKGRAPSEPREVKRMTQAEYSRYSGPEGYYHIQQYTFGETTFKMRTKRRGHWDYSAAESVVILTDKPQKPLPVDWNVLTEKPEPAPAGQLF